jgi:carbon monoxide dehydrogenase subunit G
MNPRVFTTSRHIKATPMQVWEVLVDVSRWPEWLPTVESVQRLDDGEFQVGSRAMVRQPKLPQAVWRVTELSTGRTFTWESKGPGTRTIGRHEVVQDGTDTRVTLSIEQLGVLGGLAAIAWGRLTKRYIELEAESLDKRAAGEAAD